MKQTQKSKYYCKTCNIYYDMLGDYYKNHHNKLYCPECGNEIIHI